MEKMCFILPTTRHDTAVVCMLSVRRRSLGGSDQAVADSLWHT